MFARAAAGLSGGRQRKRLNALLKQTNLDPTFFSRLGISMDGKGMQSAFAEHPWVFAVIASRARQLAQVPWKVGRTLPDGTTEEIVSHKLVDLFERPNRAMTGEMLWQLTSVWLDLLGESFWILDRKNVAEIPKRIWPWPGGSRWTPGPLGPDKLPLAWVLETPDGRRRIIPTEQVVHFHTPNPLNPARGFSPLTPADGTLTADHLQEEYWGKFFENGAQPGGFLKYQQPLDDDRWEEVKRRWNDEHQGVDNSHLVAILDDGAEWVGNEIDFSKMEFTGLRESAREVICGVFGWPKWALGITDDMNFATAVAAKRTLWEENIIPTLRMRESTLQGQFFRFLEAGTLTGFFDIENVPALQQVRESKWETALKMIKAGVSLEETSRLLDLGVKPQPGWAEVWRPLNMAPTADLLSGAADGPTLPMPAEPAEEPDDDDEGDEPASAAVLPARLDADLAPMPADVEAVLAVWDAESRAAEKRIDARIATIRDKGRREDALRRRRIWRTWNREVLQPSERAMVRALRPYFGELADDQLARFDSVARQRSAARIPGVRVRVVQAEDIDDILFDRDEWNDTLRRKMRPVMNAALDLSNAFTTTELGPQAAVDLLSPDVQRFLQTRTRLISRVNDTVRRAVARTLQEGIAEGDTVAGLRTRIQTIGDNLRSPVRAATIARTESGALVNSLRFQQAQANVDFGIWVTAADEDVRSSHFVAEFTSADVPVRVGTPFSNGLLHPNDPGGPAEEVINCRCVMELVPRSQNPERAVVTHVNRIAPEVLAERSIEPTLAAVRWAMAGTNGLN